MREKIERNTQLVSKTNEFISVVVDDDDDGTCEVLHTQQAMNWDTIVLSTIPLPASRRRECINDSGVDIGKSNPFNSSANKVWCRLSC